MKAILELPRMPASCNLCPLRSEKRNVLGIYYCSVLMEQCEDDSRRLDCPLKHDKSDDEIRRLKEKIAQQEKRLCEAAAVLAKEAVCPDEDSKHWCIDSCYECWLEYLNRET
jgi:hypothetical protein